MYKIYLSEEGSYMCALSSQTKQTDQKWKFRFHTSSILDSKTKLLSSFNISIQEQADYVGLGIWGL